MRTHKGRVLNPSIPVPNHPNPWEKSEDPVEEYLNILREYIDNTPASWQLDENSGERFCKRAGLEPAPTEVVSEYGFFAGALISISFLSILPGVAYGCRGGF